jgi:flavin reductase (DIM6/NTAB) family NADH-FMN oxidoreductase RutF
MTEPDNELLMAAFREVMASVATPVTVVTAMDDGRPHGTTVSAFVSLSMQPPMVLVALDRRSELLGLVKASPRFGVNVLERGQSELALAFARKGGVGKFVGVSWEMDRDIPRLLGASGWLACEVADLIDGGDHVIVLGHVVSAETAGGDPLTYHARAFGTHVALA